MVGKDEGELRDSRLCGRTTGERASREQSFSKYPRVGINLEVSLKVGQNQLMGNKLTIGELAATAGVPSSTVRYYERAGLLRPSSRSPSNYRLYSEQELERLRFIRAAQATGFTLENVKALLRPAACGKVQGVIEERLAEVNERMKELRHVKRVLRASLEECQSHEASGRCRVVDELTARSKSPA